MFVKKWVCLLGFCLFLTGCATSKYTSSESNTTATKKETASELGVRYLLGHGVPQDNAKALAYFSQAADDDDAIAENELAYLYAAGKGTAQDMKKAFYYYQKAANHGLASAQYNLGILYQHGLGTEPNAELAQTWFKKSAAHGFEPARQALAHHES